MRYRATVTTHRQKPELLTRERCFVAELLNDAATPEVSLARCRVKPGVTTELHRLGVLEWYVIESGSGTMRIGEAESFRVGAGDTVRIPAGTPQQVTNDADTDLVFLCVCVPRYTPASYETVEQPR